MARGSTRKMDAEAARQKARRMKAEALGVLEYYYYNSEANLRGPGVRGDPE
jgi:hypothetical protein